ncbi:hypothetical protein ACFOMD_01690 [Sphingoaurantiacus capsulatus]|uniref:Lipoprotein n=1 Tax=Sphingoaurantiacus capsulatus TaxID=1771310 RepID=A0ABV7X852_9SPHN
MMIAMVAAMLMTALMPVGAAHDDPSLAAHLAKMALLDGYEYVPSSIRMRNVTANPGDGSAWFCGEFAGTLTEGEQIEFRGFIVSARGEGAIFHPIAILRGLPHYESDIAEYDEAVAERC